jgi:hypothetical protein
MATYVLTYNPAKWQWDPRDRAAAVRRTGRGQVVKGEWSTGVRTSGITPGDRAVLLQQGTGDRGLIARGTFTSTVSKGKHWDGSGRLANYAAVVWDVMLPEADMIPIDELVDKVTTVAWNKIQGSGIVVPEPGDAALERLWPSLGVKAVPSPKPSPRSRRSQAWQNDPVRRKAVEDYAQELLTTAYEKRGWKVTDTRVGNPYDAVARKGSKVRYLEAKGTETDGVSVLVTPGEVRWAAKHPGECVIGIVSGITFDESQRPSGTLAEFEWDPNSGKLSPQSYSWRPDLS